MDKRRIVRNLSWIMVVMIFALLIAVAIDQIKEQNENSIAHGVLDLSSWNYDNVVVLNGEAEFYWEKLLTESDFASEITPDSMPVIPSVWNYYDLSSGLKLSGKGYATYRIQVTGVQPGEALAMRVQPLSTAYDLYIDDELMVSCGNVGTTESSSDPHYDIETFQFTPQSDHFDIIIHISNFTYNRGGLWYPIDFGTPDQIDKVNMSIYARDVLAVGVFSLLLIYSLFYSILRRDKYLILFMAMEVLLISRILVTGSYLINSIFQTVDFNVYIWLNYIPICLLSSVCLMIVYHYFPVGISKTAVRVSLCISAIAIAATLLLPTYIFTRFTYAILGFILLPISYGLWKLICACVINRQKRSLDRLFMTVGVIVVILCGVRDIMFNENLIKFGHLDITPIGFMALILLWDLSITYRYELLTRDRLRVLQELNVSVEREKALELQFLKSQIRPHFINNALNTIISISRTDSDKSRALLVQFSKYLRGCYDFENLDDVIPLEQELDYVDSYLAIELARFGDKLQVEYDIDDTTVCVPPLILQPLVENAVVHGVRGRSGGGHILIYVKTDGPFIKIGVKDDGNGMKQEEIEAVFSKTSTKRGIALYNINDRLQRLYHTGLTIVSPASGGLDISALIRKGRVD